MAANYVLLERIELNATTASITFSNIPQSGYTDLKIVASTRDSAANNLCSMYFNGDTNSANYTNRYLQGTGTGSPASGTNSSWLVAGIQETSSQTANTFASGEFYIPNYTSSNQKSVSVEGVQEANIVDAWAWMNASKWSGTAAITSVTLAGIGASFVQYSTFSLYGLAATGTTPVIAPKASGGNITTDGTYWYHAFLTSGTFTPATSLSCDYLVVAGGGGGPGELGGGAGAGGLRSTVGATGGGGSLESPLSLASGTAYTVTIGAGGSGGTGGTFDLDNATNGSNSVFATITSIGGGHGAKAISYSGGSGSGAGGNGGTFTGGAGTANQGYAGGTTPNPQNPGYAGGGGGGAGAVGSNATTINGGNGGAGVAISALATATNTGVSNYYAGGGGGGVYSGDGTNRTSGTGGSGGGGSASNGVAGSDLPGNPGVANTGGGGGSASRGTNTGSNQKAGGNGGSGIVIIRYAMA